MVFTRVMVFACVLLLTRVLALTRVMAFTITIKTLSPDSVFFSDRRIKDKMSFFEA